MALSRIIIATMALVACLTAASPAKALAYNFKPLEQVVQQAVSDSVFPGASVAILFRGHVVFHQAFGRMTYQPESALVTTTTIYDLASLTKAIATTSTIMQLVERDSLALYAPVSRYFPAFGQRGKASVTIEQLLRHTSGLRAHTLFSKRCATEDDVVNAIAADTLFSAPGTETVYSDLGFIMLGKIVEKVTGKSLAANFHERFAKPLGMTSTMFTPNDSLKRRIAPVEKDAFWPLCTPRPLVHDQNAALLGGVAGHAGLYSTTGDLLRVTAMLMNGGTLDGRRYISNETLHRFTGRTSYPRALGWDLRSPLWSPKSKSSAGDYFSSASYGHLGFTGTSIWIDPEKELAVIILSNRVYPTSENIGIRTFRPLLHNTVAQCLGFQLKQIKQTALPSAQ